MPKKVETAPVHRRIVGQAWRIAWHHKYLWIFGFFATLAGFGAVTEVLFDAFQRTTDFLPSLATKDSLLAAIPGMTTIRAIVNFSQYPTATLFIFLLAMALMVAVFAWMTMVSIGGLVNGVRRAARGGEPKFAEDVKVGADKFWTVLLVNVLAKAIIVMSYFLSGANLYLLMKERTATSAFFYLGSFVLMTIIAFLASLLATYGSINAVIKNENAERSVASAASMIGRHWLVSFEMAAILLFVSLGLGVAAALIALVLSVPLIFFVAVAAMVGAQSIVLGLIALTAIMLLVMVVCLGSLLTTLQTAAWTLLWAELAEGSASAKLIRVAGRFHGRLTR